jgi:chromosome segregation ATPase
VTALPQVGYLDLCRRFWIARITIERLRLRRKIYEAETELGWLGWEQVEFYDEDTNAQIAKIHEFENAQASLQNTSAELAGHKVALDEELAHETTLHDQAQAALASERDPLAARAQELEPHRQDKLEIIERFDRAIAELTNRELELEELSLTFMNVEHPTLEHRNEAREISEELTRLADERKFVQSGKSNVVGELTAVETELSGLLAGIERIDTQSAQAREALAATARRVSDEIRLLEREKEKSNIHMSNIDREKQKPYRFIGACLADHGIAPRNQPEILDKVMNFRARDLQLADELAALRAACAATPPSLLISFYLLLLVLLSVLCALLFHVR